MGQWRNAQDNITHSDILPGRDNVLRNRFRANVVCTRIVASTGLHDNRAKSAKTGDRDWQQRYQNRHDRSQEASHGDTFCSEDTERQGQLRDRREYRPKHEKGQCRRGSGRDRPWD